MTIETLVAADYLQVRRRHFDRAVAFHSSDFRSSPDSRHTSPLRAFNASNFKQRIYPRRNPAFPQARED